MKVTWAWPAVKFIAYVFGIASSDWLDVAVKSLSKRGVLRSVMSDAMKRAGAQQGWQSGRHTMIEVNGPTVAPKNNSPKGSEKE